MGITNWIEPQPIQVPGSLRAAVGGHPLVAETLARRGILTPEAARAFLDPAHYAPAPPEELPDLTIAAKRIEAAIGGGERICVWGDFDVDGQTATALLVTTLRGLGAEVMHYIPVRARESHGIGRASLQRVLDAGVQLILTCDTGVAEHAAVVYAASRGADVIVTDHHYLPPTLPPACAVVNPRRLPSGHPLAELPGVGVAYKLAEALLVRAGRMNQARETTQELLDLVALGIVGDVAAQVADVRYLLQRGLKVLRCTERLGLQELMRVAGILPTDVTEEQIGFVLAPRLNALGRLADANLAVELFTTADLVRARTLAHELEGLNAKRRFLTQQVQQGALTRIESDPSLLKEPVLVLSHPNWPASVVGIVAGRLAERYQRPAILISTSPGQRARGSARSVPGVDISAAIAAHGEMLHRFGGHPMAAGLSLDPEQIPAFRRALSCTVARMAAETAEAAAITADAYLPLVELSLDLVAELERLAPFGNGNPPLTLAARNLRLAGDAKIGRHEEHRRITVRDEAGQTYEAFWWHSTDWPLPQGSFDLAYTVRASDYLGQRGVQIEWVAARECEPERVAVAARPARQVQDYRRISNPREVLAGLAGRKEVQVWAEGEAAIVVGARGRHQLTPGPALAIWTGPPGPVELQAVLERVAPQTVYLFGQPPHSDDLKGFLTRLAGLVKHVLNEQGGQTHLAALAAATAQREITVRAGLEWLVARGQICLVKATGDALTLSPGDGQRRDEARQVQSRIKALLEETAAYRSFFLRADLDRLMEI
ncbi:MAG: single-stranded-DNA-specific exonuclease RecJ [Anaerolineae bacterium]|nr:MAG: single-stranded-DNA-specific exonuclease RecJ [Anaerolineae bacterium]